MSSPNLRSLASEWPRQRRQLERLEKVLRKGESYEFDRLVDLVDPDSETDFRFLLGALVRSGHLHLLFRVISPETHGGIEDFDSLEQIPDKILDWRTGREIEVTSENLRALYELPSARV